MLFLVFFVSYIVSCCEIDVPRSPIIVPTCLETDFAGSGSAPLEWTDVFTGRVLGSGAQIRTAFAPGLHKTKLSCNNSSEASVFVFSVPPEEQVDHYLTSLGACEIDKKTIGLEYWIDRVNTIVTHVKQPNLARLNPTNVNAVSGSFSGLTAGFSEVGDLTFLLYPGPGGNDQLEYETSGIENPRRGAKANMGAFAGIMFVDENGKTEMKWLRDWRIRNRQHYENDESSVVVTQFENDEFSVTQRDVVAIPPHKNVLFRSFSVTLNDKFAQEQRGNGKHYLVHYENLAPISFQIPLLPLSDNVFDFFNDFATFYDSSRDVVIHFRPDSPTHSEDWNELLNFAVNNPINTTEREKIQKSVNNYCTKLDDLFGNGVYFAIGSMKRDSSASFVSRVTDNAPFIPSVHPSDIFSPYVVGRGTSALFYELDFNKNGIDEVVVVFAAGDTSESAQTELTWAREQDINNIITSSNNWWKEMLKDIVFPKTESSEELMMYKRGMIVSLLSISEGGATVASVASTPSYNCDWLRDGAYLNLILDMNGFQDLVTNHIKFWASVQRKDGDWMGSYDMNFYADGSPCGMVPLEIDQVGLSAWSMCLHSQFLEQSEQEKYLENIWASLKLSVDFLYRWRDEETDLPKPANVDDDPGLKVNLQGSLAVLLGLKSGIFCGKLVGESESRLEEWRDYAKKLQAKIMTAFYNPKYHAWGLETANCSTGQGIRGATWFLWPSIIQPLNSTEAKMQADAILNVSKHFEKCIEGMYGYPPQALIALLMHYVSVNDSSGLSYAHSALRQFVTVMATPETRHYPEWVWLKNSNPKCRSIEEYKEENKCCETASYVQMNDMPHNWEHALVNLIMRKLYGPWPSQTDVIAQMDL